jgi:hypothetical protein
MNTLLALPAPKVIGSQNIGPNKITLRYAAVLRKDRMDYHTGDGYWEKDTANLLSYNFGYYRVITHTLSGNPPAGTIHRRKATSGKYGRSRKNKFGESLKSAITISERNATYVHIDGTDKTQYAPKGMVFSSDDNGVFLKRLSDGMDYHITDEDWKSKRFATRIRKGMAENFKVRRLQKVAEKQAANSLKEKESIDKIFKRDLSTTRVTLLDSRKAGNCIEGSLAFAERKLNIKRDEILEAGYLFSVSAKRLLAVANGDMARVLAACKVAWQRETLISI